MCGITGIISRNGIDDGAQAAVERMAALLRHRGPDGGGAYRDAFVSLAMRRLSIIDLAGGWQPLLSEDKSLALIANGEIYNFVELRKALQEHGHVFSSGSDCETIIHLYEEFGEDCVHRLRGMFAFALYDTRRKKVLIARDRMGEKPLYFRERNGTLLFSSELKSLLGSGLVPFALSPVDVNDYFHYQFVPEPRTPLAGVGKLPAGCRLLVELDPWSVRQTSYWNLEDAEPVEGDPATLIRGELDSISELIIRSDVPVGVALSGGLDSSAIAALAVHKYPGTMHAFSVGYRGMPSCDERNHARRLAGHFNMPFHEIELAVDDFADTFDEVNMMRDDPIADISGYGYYAVSKAARHGGVPVLLQGQGGDELFWGYPWVRDAVLLSESALKGSSAFVRLLGYAAATVPKRLTARAGREFYRWMRSLVAVLGRDGSSSPHRPVFYELTPDFQMARREMARCYAPRFSEQLEEDSAFRLYTYDHPWQQTDIRITKLICDTYLLENGLAQGDRLSMANSVELRLPLVDYKLVELVIGLRKTHGADPDYRGFPKPWLRQAVADLLPAWVFQRPKQGFAPPIREWHASIFRRYGHALRDGYLVQEGVLSRGGGEQMAAGAFPNGAVAPLSFKALVLELWCRRMEAISKNAKGGADVPR